MPHNKSSMKSTAHSFICFTMCVWNSRPFVVCCIIIRVREGHDILSGWSLNVVHKCVFDANFLQIRWTHTLIRTTQMDATFFLLKNINDLCTCFVCIEWFMWMLIFFSSMHAVCVIHLFFFSFGRFDCNCIIWSFAGACK